MFDDSEYRSAMENVITRFHDEMKKFVPDEHTLIC